MKYKVITLKNKNGMAMKVTDLGGIVMSLTAPDANGVFEDILLGFDNVEKFKKNIYINSLIGRVGNRISKGRFSIDDKEYSVALNSEKDGVKCSLHGGDAGFHDKIWDMRPFTSPEGPAVELTCLSPNGEGGYPGNLSVRVVYTLMECNAWKIDYMAITDSPTIVNLTQHAYFNLSGCKRDITNHILQLFCSKYTAVGKGLIPTGKIRAVSGTPLDFTEPKVIGDEINSKDSVIAVAGGYDHNFIVDRYGTDLAICAILEDEESGRLMEVWTTEPCVQFYSGNFLDGTVVGKNKVAYNKRFGLCLETQHAPDSPNNANFKSIRLNPGEIYRSTTIYQFTTTAAYGA